MFELLFDDIFIPVSKDNFFKFIDFYSKFYDIVKVLTCSDNLLFMIEDKKKDIWCMVGKVSDDDYLIPFREAMVSEDLF